MAIFVRKIEFNKWIQRRILEGEHPSGDAITNCMKTRGNSLSIWSIADENKLEDIIIAIAAHFDNLDAIDVLKIDPSLIEEKGLLLEECPGLTPYIDFVNNHLNIVNLDYYSLGLMAEVIVESIRKGGRKRITFGELKRILTKAVEEGKIQWADLKPGVKKKIPNN